MKRLFIFLLLFVSAVSAQKIDTAMTIGTNFWDQAWGGADPWKNGYEKAIDADSINIESYNPWKSEFLEEISFYSVLRFMDYGRINNNHHEKYWVDRVKRTDENQVRMALYWMIDLCNRTNTDLWYCIPELAVKDYWENAAKLIKEKLNPDLKVYIEWSNEPFNPQFKAYQTGIDSGKAYDLWFPGDEGKSWGDQRISARYTVFISVKIWNTFEEVFGDQFNDRVIKAFAGAAGNAWWDAAQFNAFTDSKINPGNKLPDKFAIAPYVGGNLNGADPEILSKMNSELDKVENNIKKIIKEMKGTGQWSVQMPPHSGFKNIQLICYEAGQHLLTNSNSFALSMDSYEWYKNYLDRLSNYIKGPMLHYTHSGKWGNMAWGLKNEIGQPIEESPKFMAVHNWYIDNVLSDKGQSYNLNIINGTGSGNYYGGMYIPIKADAETDSLIFERWIGDTVFVEDVYSKSTVVKIIDQNISLTAMYKTPPNIIRFEAERATLVGVVLDSSKAGYSGTSYVKGESFVDDDDKIEFNVEVDTSQNYKLYIGYNGSFGEKHQNIFINNDEGTYFYFPQTSSWKVIEFGDINLNKGNNLISIQKSWGWMDVDFIEIEGNGVIPENTVPAFSNELPNDTIIVVENWPAQISYNFYAEDEQGDEIFYSLIDAPPGAEINGAGEFQFIPTPLIDIGKYSYEIIVQITDRYLTKTHTFTITLDVITDLQADTQLPKEYSLIQNYPNPFNPNTIIEYSVPVSNRGKNSLQIDIYDILGKHVKTLVNRAHTPGNYKINFNADGLKSGVYIYEMVTEKFSDSKKMILLR